MDIIQAEKAADEKVSEFSAITPTPSFSPSLIELSNVGKVFGTHQVLDNINLSVPAGEVLSIIGPSGSGKSTLLRCINQLDPHSSGEITVGDVKMSGGKKLTKKELLALRSITGTVFQSFNLFPHMSVLKNVSLAQIKVLGRSKTDADARSLGLLKRVGLEHKAYDLPSMCSGGQQQRIAIARALALDPKVILFDEPTSALDPELGLEVLTVMRELADSGTTMIVVTHEMKFAETVSNRVLIMADGKVIEEGPSEKIMRSPTTERAKKFLRAVQDR